jgi:xanthine/uracil/vitamin C permease (AzgA family)
MNPPCSHTPTKVPTVRRELLAGLTTFMTMAYVIVVNPRILSEAGMPVEGVLSRRAFRRRWRRW